MYVSKPGNFTDWGSEGVNVRLYGLFWHQTLHLAAFSTVVDESKHSSVSKLRKKEKKKKKEKRKEKKREIRIGHDDVSYRESGWRGVGG